MLKGRWLCGLAGDGGPWSCGRWCFRPVGSGLRGHTWACLGLLGPLTPSGVVACVTCVHRLLPEEGPSGVGGVMRSPGTRPVCSPRPHSAGWACGSRMGSVGPGTR